MRIVREEGFGGLFKGCGPTVVRAMALNMGMFASNEFAKDAVESMGMAKGTTGNNLTAALVSGFFASACSLPFDYVKTQIQKMQPLPDGTMPYKGLVGEHSKCMRRRCLLVARERAGANPGLARVLSQTARCRRSGSTARSASTRASRRSTCASGRT